MRSLYITVMGQHKDRIVRAETNHDVHWSVSTRSTLLHKGAIPATQGPAHLYLVIEMTLIRSGLETNPGPGSDYCTDDCGKGRKDTGDMIRCCMCAQWFHLECLNLNKAEATGVWPCLDCRVLGGKVKNITKSLQMITQPAVMTRVFRGF